MIIPLRYTLNFWLCNELYNSVLKFLSSPVCTAKKVALRAAFFCLKDKIYTAYIIQSLKNNS